jgi:hypothetical protein
MMAEASRAVVQALMDIELGFFEDERVFLFDVENRLPIGVLGVIRRAGRVVRSNACRKGSEEARIENVVRVEGLREVVVRKR